MELDLNAKLWNSSLRPEEREFYYKGLPSYPALVARTGTPWKPSTGSWAYSQRKDLRVVGNHALKEVHALLDSKEVKWTSTDVVRIGDVEESSTPVVLWIGVIPASLSNEEGRVVALKCHGLFEDYGITDVDVEIRESVVTRSTGPKFLRPTSPAFSCSSDGTFKPDVREPLTASLGLPISAESTPLVEGTGGFFIAEGGDSKRLFFVTARHVYDNNKFACEAEGQPRHSVVLFGDAAFNNFLTLIKDTIGDNAFNVHFQRRRIKTAEERSEPTAEKVRKHAEALAHEAKQALVDLNAFYQEVSMHWATVESRTLGHVIFSPPISVGGGIEQYTVDFAIIEIDASKIDKSNFEGNVIDLCTKIGVGKFSRMMRPNYEDRDAFKYPWDNLLRLSGTIPDEEMRRPTMLDKKGVPRLMVLKRGNTTRLTVGRANDILSYARNYDDDNNNPVTSKEWAILPFDQESGAFSEKGDSGSVIADGRGRMGGLLTGGAGSMRGLDITYATPIDFLMKRIQTNGFPNAHLNPVLNA
ncbi:hypothetical protein BD410DRAFT_813675 [Rickenella mellea]|uniref:Uncharacterized protein n=1 Tax=Rickenella mellea TaxID=50990 RepID=A0A4Y7QBC6_9AGAM|nr:hypothetical protein BD410DRAFT_813675 [Rickenella mellea]